VSADQCPVTPAAGTASTVKLAVPPAASAAKGTLNLRRLRFFFAFLAVLVGLLLPASATADISEYPLGAPSATPRYIAAGSDGALWFTEQGLSRIGRITTDGTISHFPTPTDDSNPYAITAGPDGAVWFSEQSPSQIGRITSDGTITEYPVPNVYGVAAGPDGAVWFTDTTYQENRIGRITSEGTVSEFPISTTQKAPLGITAGPDGALWFTEAFANAVGRITTDGTLSEYPLPTDSAYPFWITAGPDGALWFTEQQGNKIGRITTDGTITEYPLGTSSPNAITPGPDGALWFTEGSGNSIGRITTDGEIREFPLPTNDSNPSGITAGPDGALWFTELQPAQIGRIVPPVDSTSEDAPAGGTVSTNSDTSPEDPVGSSVTTPLAGTVTIDEVSTTTPTPTGYSLLGQEVEITAPDASAEEPLVLEFRLDASLLPSGADEASVQIFRDGAPIADCDPDAGTAAHPDPCVASRTVTGDGVEFTVRTSRASTWNFGVVDTTPPETTIASGPSSTTSDSTPTFGFSSSEEGSSFECRFDSDQFASCSGPGDNHTPAAALADGSHTFEVRATDPGGNTDPTPASRTFTVDTTPPDTTITGGPSGGTNDPTPTFTFASSESGSSFECKLDSGSFASCASPKTTSHLADGSHTFSVRATDESGNVDGTPASRTFTVRTAEVKVSGSTLVVTAATGAKDNLRITLPSASTLRVTDVPSGTYTGSGVHAGAGCTRSGDYTANCNASGITLIQLTSADQTDRVTNSTAVEASLNGGAANDVLSGGSADDTITGGPDADVMKGMNGDDRLYARDGTSDTSINCDGGTTPGAADQAVLDALPKDPDSAVAGCETKTRPYPYVALGDSLTRGLYASSPAKSFVGLLYSRYQTSLGANVLINEGESGATSTSLRNGGQLSRGLADINDPSDTRAATIEVGANDAFFGPCADHWDQPSTCPFRANFRQILLELQSALRDDAGAERFTGMAYYNPPNATIGGTRADRDRNLLGTNLSIGCSDSGAQVGLNDVIFQEAGRLGIPVADTYPAFKQHPEYISSSDPWRLHPNDAGYAAIAQAFQNATVRCGT
jgi:virginiamycin B lyase